MLNHMRRRIVRRIISALRAEDPVKLSACLQLQSSLRSLSARFFLPLNRWNMEQLQDLPQNDQEFSFDLNANGLEVTCESCYFARATLRSIVQEKKRFGTTGDVHHYLPVKGNVLPLPQNQNVLVEFSSPNIAKPFHAGHLRSTIIGNVISNVYEALGHKVTRVNYLGDWGTQFGLLCAAYSRYGEAQKLDEDPIKHLYEIYVRINKDVEKEKVDRNINTFDTASSREGREYFKKLEEGDAETLKLWQTFREKSIQEYEAIYNRLGVRFDVHEGESMYHGKAEDVVKVLKAKNLLEINSATGVGFVDLTEFGTGKHLPASVLKSDGTTLYLMRDVAAAIERQAKYGFDKVHYVVENGQHLHFFQLLHVLQKMGHTWIDRCRDNFHVKFGRVEGMSTRRGDVVFLSDILDEARARMEQSIKEKKTTKVSFTDASHVADQLGVSAIVVQDLHASRLKNYKFSWDKMLNFKADSGVFLQYAHARLKSLEENCDVILNTDCDVSYLCEPEAVRLIVHLARFDEVLRGTLADLEPYILVKYLCQLGHLINSANHKLTVKGQEVNAAQARLLLFYCSRIVLANGLRILGLEPVDKM